MEEFRSRIRIKRERRKEQKDLILPEVWGARKEYHVVSCKGELVPSSFKLVTRIPAVHPLLTAASWVEGQAGFQ